MMKSNFRLYESLDEFHADLYAGLANYFEVVANELDENNNHGSRELSHRDVVNGLHRYGKLYDDGEIRKPDMQLCNDFINFLLECHCVNLIGYDGQSEVYQMQYGFETNAWLEEDCRKLASELNQLSRFIDEFAPILFTD